MYTHHIVIAILRNVYERSCPFLTIKSPYKRYKPVDVASYMQQFWSSRQKSKQTAQSLLTFNELQNIIENDQQGTAAHDIQGTLQALLDAGAICTVVVDVDEQGVEKLVLTPLGLQLWQKLDDLPLLDQQRGPYQSIGHILSQDMLAQFVQTEANAWLKAKQQQQLAPKPPAVSSRGLCLGLFLLLNGAVTRTAALHLVQTSIRDYQFSDILVQGLNTIGQQFLGQESLFRVPTLKDDLQRRKELVTDFGPLFKYILPRKGEHSEYWWWEIGDYEHDSTALDRIVRTLCDRGIHMSRKLPLPPTEERLQFLIGTFRHRINSPMPRFEATSLFPASPGSTFTQALNASIRRTLDKRDK